MKRKLAPVGCEPPSAVSYLFPCFNHSNLSLSPASSLPVLNPMEYLADWNHPSFTLSPTIDAHRLTSALPQVRIDPTVIAVVLAATSNPTETYQPHFHPSSV